MVSVGVVAVRECPVVYVKKGRPVSDTARTQQVSEKSIPCIFHRLRAPLRPRPILAVLPCFTGCGAQRESGDTDGDDGAIGRGNATKQ